MKRRLPSILAVNLASLALLLGALELTARILAPTEAPQPLVATTKEAWASRREFDPRLFWRMTPRRDAEGRVIVNRLGLRGPLPEAKVPGEVRILSLGESTTAGLALPLEQTYTSVVARRLEASLGRPVTAVNAGVSGYSLAQGVELARLHGSDLEPDVVLTYFGYNDLLRVGFRAERDAAVDERTAGFTDRQLLLARRRPVERSLLWLQARSQFVRWLTLSDASDVELRRGDEVRVPAEDRRLLYGELRQLCAEQGARLVVLVPIYRGFTRHEKLLRGLAGAGFEVVDLPALLGPELGPRRQWFFDAVHPRAELHRRIGEAVARHLAGAAAPSSADGA